MIYTRKGVSEKLGIGIETLRFYEKLKIIAPPQRDDNGYRLYSEEDVLKIKHIVHAKKYGFTLKEIRSALEKPNLKNEDIKELIEMKLDQVEKKIKELNDLKSKLVELRENL